MNYATQHNIGNYQNPTPIQNIATASTVRKVRRLDATSKGCGRSAKRQAESRADKHLADGFLKATFLPKLQQKENAQPCNKSEKLERDFYKSLSQMAGHYGIEPIPSQHYNYPYNIALALDDIKIQLQGKVKDWDELRLLQDSRKVYFISEERYNTGSTLYYIPIVPLYRLSKMPQRKHAAELLQSACSYLYHIADVPYYRQENSYLFWIYEMVTEWVTCDDQNEDTPTYLAEIGQAQWIGDIMERKIFSHQNLSRFKERLGKFTSRDSLDHDCFMLATKAFDLYEQYPNDTIYRNARTYGDAGDHNYEGIVSMDKYVSFCAEANGLLFQTLFDSVNNELQEYGQMQEPVISKRFDGRKITDNTLCFENRVFTLIEELIYILNSF